MTRSPSVEQPPYQTQQPTSKPSKRKGTRSVSTLTPSQLARKRANDREAQRAIRARTKEHIERLERELEELKSRHSRDEMVQDLLKRNKALERELMALRESLGIQGRQYSNQVYEDNGASRAPTNRPSSYGRSSEYGSGGGGSGSGGSTSNFGGPSYLPTPEPCESWSSVVPVSAVSVPSVVSSPASSAANDEYVAGGYIPTSVPSNMMETTGIQPPAIQCIENNKMEYDDMDHGGFRLVKPAAREASSQVLTFGAGGAGSSERGNYNHSHHHSSPPSYMHHHQPWPPVYSANTYYPQSPAL